MGMRELFEAAGRRHGVVGPACARDHEVSWPTLRARARREGWPEPFPRTLVLPGHAVTGATLAVAAGLATAGPVALTGWSALAHHGLVRAWPSTIELLVPQHGRTVALPGVDTRWTSRWPTDVVDLGGLGVVSVARALADRAGGLELAAARRVAFDAVSRGLLEVRDLEAELAARGRFAGRGRYRQLADDLTGDGSESGFEFEARERLIDRGLPPLAGQPDVWTGRRTRRVDIAYPGDIGIECHSRTFHGSAAAFERDARRSNEIAAIDTWLLLRLTFRAFHLDWDAFEALLRSCLHRRRWRG
jgi:hypothetical protein